MSGNDLQGGSSGSTIDIESGDVIRLVLQFLKENNLTGTLKKLQQESQTSLNTVDNVETFVADISNGHWDRVLSQVTTLKIPQGKLFNLYEQIVIEMLELKEVDMAKSLLRDTEVMEVMKKEETERYLKLERLSNRIDFDPREAYPSGSGKERKRAELAKEFSGEVTVVAPARLMSLLGQALKWQRSQGLLPDNMTAQYDLFRGGRRETKEQDDKPPSKQAGVLKFGDKNHAECAMFSMDGSMLVTGSVDGLVEAWDFERCRWRQDLSYQAADEFMMHEESVMCCVFSKDTELLATGDSAGKIKVWRVSTGKCVRRFERAHAKGITGLCFTRDGSQLLSCSFDHMIRLHGLKSGKTLKEFRGHSSYVNTISMMPDGSKVLSASSDGTVKLWDLKTTECLRTFRSPQASNNAMSEAAIHTVIPLPRSVDQIIVCARSSVVHIVTVQGQVVKTFSHGKKTGGDFVCCTVSPQGKWIYCIGEDNVLYCFSIATGLLEKTMKGVSTKEVIGIAHHPHRNLIATYSDEGILKLWKP